jgi:3-isopropylmalate dehydrogenase
MKYDIAVLPGDGIGPEVVAEATKVLETIGRKFKHDFVFHYGDVGGASIDKHGEALTKDTLKLCKRCRAALLGAVGGPKWDDPLGKVRPEDGLFANLRPVKVLPMLADHSTLKPEVVHGVDLLVVRELTGGLYFGRPKRRWQTSQGRRAVDSMSYSEMEIERILRVGFELARRRRKKLTSVDKANVLESSRLWRQIASELASQYPDIQLEHQLVDSCAMRLIQRPVEFDVIVTENTFGDILTDEASMLAGSMGMLPSASLAGIPSEGSAIFGLYEPIHGSSPKRAGLNMANPIATILSSALMLRYSLGLTREAQAIEKSVSKALNDGYRTYDIMSDDMTKVGTEEMGDLIASRI